MVPADSTLGITSFQDLTKDDVKKITYGDPKAAPHGVAAEEILNKLGIFDQVSPRSIYAQNVSQALEYITRGEVDAGIIFATEAMAGGDKVKVVATADPAWYTKIAYPIAVVTASKVKTWARPSSTTSPVPRAVHPRRSTGSCRPRPSSARGVRPLPLARRPLLSLYWPQYSVELAGGSVMS